MPILVTPTKRRAIALVLLAALCTLVLAGCCGFNSTAVRDIVVIRLAADGAGEWQRTIDSGYDDAGEGVVELIDGRLVIIGRKGADSYSPGYPNWVLLSSSGEVIDDRTDLSRRGQPRAGVATADGGWTVLEADGRLVRFGASGDLRWDENRTIENGSAADCSALTLLRDGSYLLGGAVRAAGDPTGGARPTLPVPNPTVEPLPTAPQRTGREMPAALSAEDRGARQLVTPAPTVAPNGPNATVPTTVRDARSTWTKPVVNEGLLAKVGPDGRQSWVRSYSSMSTVQSIGEDTASGGLIVAGKNLTMNEDWDESGPFVLVRSDSDGLSSSVSTMGNATREDRIRTGNTSEASRVRLLYSERTDEGAPRPPMAEATSGRATDAVDREYRPGSVRGSLTVLDVGPTGTPVPRFSVRGSPPFAATRDGGLVMVAYRETGTTDSYYEHPVGYPQPERPLGIRFDSDGRRVWERAIPVGGLTRVYAVAPTADGGFVVLGESQRVVGRGSTSEPVS